MGMSHLLLEAASERASSQAQHYLHCFRIDSTSMAMHSPILRFRNESLWLWSILSTHALLLAWLSLVNAPTFDEIGHLPSGLSHWHFGNFDLYRVNPPLMRMIATLPLLPMRPNTDWTWVSNDPYLRSEFPVGLRFIENNREYCLWYFTFCRWAQIPVSIFGAVIAFRWAYELYGKLSAFIALILWCFCPNILTWGSTITPDIGATSFGLAASYAFWRWLKVANWRASCLAGIALGAAELSKSTWIILFALWPVMWTAWLYWPRKSSGSHPAFKQLVVVMAIGVYVLNAGYGFEKSFQKLGSFDFISETLGGPDAHSSPDNRFRDTWLSELPIPLPANYLQGIDVQKFDFERGKWSYLCGEMKYGGWYHYYLYCLLVKMPFGYICLFVLSVVLFACRPRSYSAGLHSEMCIAIPALAIIALVSSQTGFNRYLRYVLPAVPFLFICASRVGKAFQLNHVTIMTLATGSLGIAVVSSLCVVPHSMSYFNLAAGGPLGGPKWLLDANIDWGQDLLFFKRFLTENPTMRPMHLAYFGYANQNLAGLECESVPQSITEEADVLLKKGWYAVSVNYVYGYKHYYNDPPMYKYFSRMTPQFTVGYSIYVYNVPEDVVVSGCTE